MRTTPNPLYAQNLIAFRATLQFDDKVLGGIPKDPDTVDTWINAVLKDKTRARALIADTKAQLPPLADDDDLKATIKDMGWTTFKADAQGLYLEARQLKALLREAANIMKENVGIKQFKARIAERLFVGAPRLHVGQPLDYPAHHHLSLGVKEPDGFVERPIHVMTQQGPRSSLKRADYVQAPQLTCCLVVWNQKLGSHAPADYLEALLLYGQHLGLGADRSQGFGTYTLMAFAPVALDAV